jgi:hypothetical protein
MRFIHQQTAEIRSFVDAAGLHVMRCSSDGSSPTITEPPSAIDVILAQSNTLWGLALPYFIRVSKSAAAGPLRLPEAVKKTEAATADDSFLIVAYQDGGVISISGRKLPFQEHAKPAGWWRP